MKRIQFALYIALIVEFCIGGSAWGQTDNEAVTNGLWSATGTWDLGHVPDSTERALIRGLYTVTVDYAAPDVGAIRLGNSGSNRGKLVIDAGASLVNQGLLEISGGLDAPWGAYKSRLNVGGTFANNGIMNIGHVNGFDQPGGALQVLSNGVVTANNTVNIGIGAKGFVDITGGTFTQFGNFDTYIGAAYDAFAADGPTGTPGQLFMDGGTYTTGDDLILAGNGVGRIGTIDLNGGAYLDITDDLFAGLNNSANSGTATINVSDAEMRVNDELYLGRYQESTMTLNHTNANVNAWRIRLGTGSAGTAEVNLIDGVLTVRGNNVDDTMLLIANGVINFDSGVLEWIDNTTEDELQAWWEDGTFSATKNGGNPESFTNILDSISYTTNFGDGFTAWVGLDGPVAKTFVTSAFIMGPIGDITVDIDGTDAIIGWEGTNLTSYSLRSTTDLATPSNDWDYVETDIPGVNGAMSTTTTTTSAESFYRITSP